MISFFSLSVTILHIINSTLKIKPIWNINIPKLNKKGEENKKLYVSKIDAEIIPKTKQNNKPYFKIYLLYFAF